MTRDNACWHVTVPLDDFDSVSLYPSAMSIMKIPLGYPKPFEGPIPPDAVYYFADVKVTKVGNHQHFSLIRYEEDGKNVWSDDKKCLNRIYPVDKRTLDDWVELAQVEYESIRGVYWNEGTTDDLSDYIKELFEKRKQLKAEGNPLQEVYKLILNSTYGKMIERPHDKQKEIIPEDKVASYISRNYNFLAPNDYQIAGSNLHVFEKYKGIKNTFHFTLIGAMVLSHSKHLMNRVMCLAQDLGIMIFYQDTDSMHIERDRVPELAAEFEKRYGFPLIGNNLCQFHSDFSSPKLEKLYPGKPIYAKESYFLGKKLYLDVLTCEGATEVDYHIRAKGISRPSIDAVVEREYNGDMTGPFRDWFDHADKPVEFNLAEGKPSFELDKTMVVRSRQEFIRRISIPASVRRLEYTGR